MLWKALARLGWSHTDFARAMQISTASAAAILYGDSRAGRRTAVLASAAPLKVRPVLWEKPCPPNWKPFHPARASARRERELAATG